MAHPACVFVHLHGERRPGRAHSHSIVNEPFLQFNINGLLVDAGGNTMKNAMFKHSFQLAGKNYRLNAALDNRRA
jgi:hypothetical protein